MFERRLLADISKIRGVMGTWGKEACKNAMGSRWSTAIWQIIKADVEGWWSAALEEWQSFGAANKDAWRAACPYQATYNDIGEMYFGLVRVVTHALAHYSGMTWESSTTWTETQSEIATTWWVKTVADALNKGKINDLDARIKRQYWTDWVHAASYGGEYLRGPFNSGNYVSTYIYGRDFQVGYCAGPVFGTVDLYVDGELVQTLDQYSSIEKPQQHITLYTGKRGLHVFKMVCTHWEGTLDFIEVL